MNLKIAKITSLVDAFLIEGKLFVLPGLELAETTHGQVKVNAEVIGGELKRRLEEVEIGEDKNSLAAFSDSLFPHSDLLARLLDGSFSRFTKNKYMARGKL